MKKLTRSDNKIIGGVLAGFGEYLVVDPTVIRIVYTLLAVFTAIVPAIVVYLAALALIPTKKSSTPHATHSHSNPEH